MWECKVDKVTFYDAKKLKIWFHAVDALSLDMEYIPPNISNFVVSNFSRG